MVFNLFTYLVTVCLLLCVVLLVSCDTYKVKSVFEPSAHQAGAYPSFLSMKRQGVTPSSKLTSTHFIHLGEERHCT